MGTRRDRRARGPHAPTITHAPTIAHAPVSAYTPYSILHTLCPPPDMNSSPVNPPASRSDTPYSILYTLAVALAATWLLNLRLLLSHDPLSRAIKMGADVAKEQALGAIPQEWMGWLAQPVIQLINEYVTPYAITGKALMASWALTLGVIIPASITLLAFVGIHLVLRITGGAPGGWRATARSVGMCLGTSDLAVLAWTWWQVAYGDDFLSRAIGLGLGLASIRLITLAWLLVDLTERHRLGAWRIVLLGVPTLLASLACSALFALAWWLWFTAGFALTALS
jgi:hypothetical protein